MNANTQKAPFKENKMGVSPIGVLLLTMSIPAISSMLVQALYNIFDTIYVSRIDTTNNQLTALGLVFPIQMLQMAVGLGIGVGANSVIARRLGAKLRGEASNMAKTSLVMAFISFLIFFSLSWFLPQLFASALNNSAEVKNMVVDYLSVVMMFSFFLFIQLIGAKILQATGKMVFPMISQLLGAITNIILDPIFIFGKGTQLGTSDSFFNFSWGLGLGVKGAAYATIIAQAVAMTFTVLVLFLLKHEVNLNFKGFKLKIRNVLEVLRVGAPVILMNSIGSIVVLFLNFFIGSVQEGGEAILTVYFRIQSFVFMPIFGLMQGAMPIMGYNFGANKKDRFYRTFNLSMKASIFILTFGFLIFQFYPDIFLIIIKVSKDLKPYTINAFRIISIGFIPAAISITIGNMFQAIGQGFKSLLMSLLRQLVIIVPLGYLFSMVIFKTLGSIWACFPISEFITLAIFFPIALKTMRREFEKKEEMSYIPS